MQINENQVKKLLTSPPKFGQLGFSMLITRLAGQYAKSPTPDVLQASTREINAFLQKFSNIMAADYALIAKL